MQPESEPRGGLHLSGRLGFVLLPGGALILVGVVSPGALRTAAVHLPIAVAIMAAASGLGIFLFDLIGIRDAERRWRLICGAGLGIGVLSLMVLGLGCCGVMNRSVWIGVLAACAGIGAWRLRYWRRHDGLLTSVVIPERGPLEGAQPHGSPRRVACGDLKAVARHGAQPPAAMGVHDGSQGRAHWMWLLVIPFAAMALLAATFPPGTLWPAEGNGYDVLEYHFGAPRDYLDAGRIAYLPHNIYANFPAVMEMLYLLSMIVHGDAIAAAPTAQMVNLLLAVLATCAVWLAARSFGTRPAAVAAIVFATCPFVTYLCGVAYVENGLLVFCALSLACVLRGFGGEAGASSSSNGRWLLLAGLFSGFACGAKYSGAAAVMLPLLSAVIWLSWRRRAGLLPAAGFFCLGVLISLGPWLVKNIVYTGNPVFPLANSIFGAHEGVWDEDCAARWREGHLPAPEDRPMGARVRRLLAEVIVSPSFGPIVLVSFMFWIAARSRKRMGPVERKVSTPADDERLAEVPCGLLVILTLLSWVSFSHLVGRFAVTIIVPAAIVLAVSLSLLEPLGRRLARMMVVILVIMNLALLVMGATSAHLFELTRIRQGDDTAWFTRGEWPTHEHVPVLNDLAAGGHGVLMVADARRFYLDGGVEYCVVFNRFPFAEAARTLTPDELFEWLRRRGTEYVFVNWSEMMRLRGSRYGFWQGVDESRFAALEQSGLKRVRDFYFDVGAGPRRYATLYRVP